MKPTRIALKKLYLLFITALFIGACEKNSDFLVPDGDSKLRAFSEISTDNKVVVSVSTSIGANSDDNFLYPKQSEAQVKLYREGVELEVPGFRYLSAQEAFVSQGAFRPEAGVEYSLEVSMSDQNSLIKPITGTTVIPILQELEHVAFSSYKEKKAGEQKEFSITAEVNLAELESDYFILKPIYHNGSEDEFLDVNYVIQGNGGTRYSKYHNGLLVNSAKANDIVRINMSNRSPIETDFVVEEISFEVVAITEDGYNYFSAFNKQLDAESVALSEPVISYSNFENGLGLFTGYSTTKSTFKVQ